MGPKMSGKSIFSNEKGRDRCVKCGSREIVRGRLEMTETVFWAEIRFLFTVKKTVFQNIEMEIDTACKCCLNCGLMWKKSMNMNESLYRKAKFPERKEKDGMKCANCGSEKLVAGKIVASIGGSIEGYHSISYNPGTKSVFRHLKNPIVFKSSLYCGDCHCVFSEFDPKYLMSYILKNCKPNHVANILSYVE